MGSLTEIQAAAREYAEAHRLHREYFRRIDRALAEGHVGLSLGSVEAAMSTALADASDALLALILGPDGSGRAAIADGKLFVVKSEETWDMSTITYRFEPESIEVVDLAEVPGAGAILAADSRAFDLAAAC